MHYFYDSSDWCGKNDISQRNGWRLLNHYGTVKGKTDVAMLTILRILDQHREPSSTLPIPATIKRDNFKIIYVSVPSPTLNPTSLSTHRQVEHMD